MLGGMAAGPTTEQVRRRRLLAAAFLVVVAAGVAVVLLSGGGGSGPKRLVPGGGTKPGDYDPLAYDSGKEGELAQRAAAGFSDVVWEKSPGGAAATARRTARWRPLIERAARVNGVDPDTLEAIVFLESAGRPDVIAGGNIEGAAGLTQIVASTATALLGMHVDLAKSRSLTARIESATTAAQARKLGRARRRIDDRFDPAAAITGAAVYLAQAQKRFGRPDLAVASYHMGVGNLEHVLSLYKDEGGGDHPSYTRLYFDSAPLRRPRTYKLLSGFGDDSSTYLWRVGAARAVMQMQRKDPAKLARLDALERSAGPGARRLYPGGAPSLDKPDPGAQSVLAYIRAGVLRLSAARLRILKAHGIRIEVSRHYRSRRQALAFQYMLDRLQAWNLIAWGRGGQTLAIVAGPDAAKVLPSAAQPTRDAARR